MFPPAVAAAPQSSSLAAPPLQYDGGAQPVWEAPPPQQQQQQQANVRIPLLPIVNWPRVNVMGILRLLGGTSVLNTLLLMAILGVAIYTSIAGTPSSSSSSSSASTSGASTQASSSSYSDSSSSSSNEVFGTWSASATLATTFTGTVMACEGSALCELRSANTLGRQYTCVRAASYEPSLAAGALSSSRAWVMLGDELVAGTGASAYSAQSWHAYLLGRVQSMRDSPVQVFNAAASATKPANISAQLQGLRQNHDFVSALADADTHITVYVSLGRHADDSTADTMRAQLDSLYDPVTGMVGSTDNAQSRFSVVLMVPPDPEWGSHASAPAVRDELLESCASAANTFVAQAQRQNTDFAAIKQTRQRVRSTLYEAAARHAVTAVVDVDAALGRFSLALASSLSVAQQQSAFSTQCSADATSNSPQNHIASPLYTDRGHYALAQLMWSCLQTRSGAYTVPAQL